MFWAFYGIVLFAGLAMMVREGLWSNTITLFVIIVAGMIAFGFYSPIVIWLNEIVTDGQHTYWLDYAVMWGLFFISVIILRLFTGGASRTRMRFKHPIDPVGGPLVGFIAAWVLAAYTLATLHVSPMSKDAFGGKLVTKSDVDSAGFMFQPDAAWLRFVERMNGPNAFGGGSTWEFSAEDWVNHYSERRAALESSKDLIVTRTKS